MQTAHGRVLLLGVVWLAALPMLFLAIQASGGEKGDWRLLGYLALWTYASPIVALAGLALALVNKVPDGLDAAARAKTRTAAIALHAMILVLSAGLLWNARG